MGRFNPHDGQPVHPQPLYWNGCPTCKHLACVCVIKSAHKEECPFRRAATCGVGIECKHSRDVCPICDPCTCESLRGVMIVDIGKFHHLLENATQRPWSDVRLGREGDGSARSEEVQICNAKGEAVAIVITDGSEEARANVNLACAAVNNLARLIEEIEVLREIAEAAKDIEDANLRYQRVPASIASEDAVERRHKRLVQALARYWT